MADMSDSDKEDDSDGPTVPRPRPQPKKNPMKRPRPTNDYFVMKDFKEDIEPFINKQQEGLSFDFRSYGKCVRTGGCGTYLR